MTGLPADPSRPWWEDEGPARADYRARLRELDGELVAIATDIAAAVGPANVAFLAGDGAIIAVEEARDERVRRRCRELEDACFVLIAREAPVAADLREVVAIVRAISDLERSSRLLVHIVCTTDRIHPPGMRPSLRTALRTLADAAGRIVCAGARAWEQRDGLAVNELSELDDEVDRLRERLLSVLYLGDHAVEDVIAVALLGRYFERLADHGVALARHVSWVVTGDRVDAP